MELRHLRYFIKAAELLHFTRAAETLYISQPTLSTHIQQLEEELGTELFSRVGRSVRLTEAGEVLLVHARQAIQELQLATDEITAVSDVVRGTISIAALPLYSSQYLPAWITAFHAKHPGVHVRARSGSSEDIEAAVSSGEVDLVFTMLPLEHPELNTKELFKDEVLLACAKSHPLSKKKKLEIEDLNGLPVAMPSQRITTARLVRKYFDEMNIQPAVVVEYDDGNALVAIARMGQLAALLPTGTFVRDPEMFCFRLPGKGLNYTSAAAWTRLSPAAKAFVDVVSEECKNIVPPVLHLIQRDKDETDRVTQSKP